MQTRSERRAYCVPLVAVVMAVAAEAVRAAGPVLARVDDAGGIAVAAIAGLIGFGAPVLVGPLVRWLGAGRATAATLAAFAVLRLAAQLGHAPGYATGMALAAVAVGALVLVCDHAARSGPAGGLRVGVGLAIGGALDTAVRGAFGTWDPIWRSGPLGWIYAIVACVALLAVLWRAYPNLGLDHPVPPRRLAVVGPWLALYLLIGSPALLSGRAGIGLPWAVATVLLGWLLAIEAIGRLSVPGGSARLPDLTGRLAGVPAAVVLLAAVATAMLAHGLLVVLAVLLGQVAAGILVARSFAPVRLDAPRPVGGAVDYALHGLAAGLAVPVVAFAGQPLLALLGAALLGLAGVGVRASTERVRRARLAGLAVVPGVLLLVPALLLLTSPGPVDGPGGDTIRLVDWNIHNGRSIDGAVDPGAIAAVLRGQRADVILLQRVGRGTVAGGGTDLAEYLSRTLAMPYVWAGSGTLILSSVPMSSVRTGTLPGGGYAAATLTLDSGQTVRVYSTQTDRPDALTRFRHDASRVILAGDLGTAAINAVGDDLTSAQDTLGHSGEDTYPSDKPNSRPDWVFGTSDISPDAFALPATTASDHRPLAVTLRLG